MEREKEKGKKKTQWKKPKTLPQIPTPKKIMLDNNQKRKSRHARKKEEIDVLNVSKVIN